MLLPPPDILQPKLPEEAVQVVVTALLCRLKAAVPQLLPFVLVVLQRPALPATVTAELAAGWADHGAGVEPGAAEQLNRQLLKGAKIKS